MQRWLEGQNVAFYYSILAYYIFDDYRTCNVLVKIYKKYCGGIDPPYLSLNTALINHMANVPSASASHAWSADLYDFLRNAYCIFCQLQGLDCLSSNLLQYFGGRRGLNPPHPPPPLNTALPGMFVFRAGIPGRVNAVDTFMFRHNLCTLFASMIYMKCIKKQLRHTDDLWKSRADFDGEIPELTLTGASQRNGPGRTFRLKWYNKNLRRKLDCHDNHSFWHHFSIFSMTLWVGNWLWCMLIRMTSLCPLDAADDVASVDVTPLM